MRVTSAALILTALLASAGAAQAQTATAPDPTRLTLSAEAATEVPETVLVATLAVVAEGGRADAVQATVNAAMAKALAAARERPAVTVSTGGYSVWPRDQDGGAGRRYRAEQTIELRADDAAGLLDLVGRLQADGLETRGLAYAVAPAATEAARRQLIERAFAELRETAGRSAAAMGMRVDRWQELRVELSGGYMPPPLRAMAMEQAGAAPPVAAAGTQRVTLGVSGTAILATSR